MKLWNEKIEILFNNFIHMISFVNIILLTITYWIVIREESQVEVAYAKSGFSLVDYIGLIFFVMLALWVYRNRVFEEIFSSSDSNYLVIIGRILDRVMVFTFELALLIIFLRDWPS